MSDDRLADAHPATTNDGKAVAWADGYSDGWLNAQNDNPRGTPNPWKGKQ